MENDKLQSHINDDVKEDIEKLYDHAKIANGEMGEIKICLEEVKTNVKWLMKSYWVVATAAIGGLIAGLLNLIQ